LGKSVLKVKHPIHDGGILLFAIASAESDLRICLTLNRTLGINLSLTDDLQVSIKNTLVSFRRYTDEGDEGIDKYNFFINRNGSVYLLPELKKIDYVLLIQSEGSLSVIEAKVLQLKSLQEFNAIYKVDLNSMKSLNRLIF
jgi:hypothetical protein